MRFARVLAIMYAVAAMCGMCVAPLRAMNAYRWEEYANVGGAALLSIALTLIDNSRGM